jgi:hypothetical protein
MPGDRHPTLEALSIPDLRNYVTSRFFAVMGRSLLHATLAWHLYDITGEVFWLGVLGAVEFLPAIPVAFVGGGLADRGDRRDILVASRSAAVLCWRVWPSMPRGQGRGTASRLASWPCR